MTAKGLEGGEWFGDKGGQMTACVAGRGHTCVLPHECVPGGESAISPKPYTSLQDSPGDPPTCKSSGDELSMGLIAQSHGES